MATQVEVGSALASLGGLSELTSKAKLQCAFTSPLPEAGGQSSEHPGPLSPLRLEERGPRPASMTPAMPRPRLTPRPFCREQSAEAFAAVKPPVPALKPSAAAPKPSVAARTLEDLPAARGPTGSVPPLLEHRLVESKAGGDVVAGVPFCASPQANTVILFQTGSADRGQVTLTPDRHLAGAPKALGTPLAPEGKLPPSTAEVSYRRPGGAGVQRQLSLSAESRPGPWSASRTDPLTDAPVGKAPEGPRQSSSHVCPASGEQPRLKQRPVSALFLESLKDPKHCTPDIADEKPFPEKPWARKPRPLSVDLTAKFESRDLSVQRKSCPSEVQERYLTAPSADGSHGRPSEGGPVPEVAGLGRGDVSKPSWRAAARAADSPGARSAADPQARMPSPSEAASLCHSTPADSGQVPAKDRKCLWEPRLKSRDEQAEREMDTVAASAKRQEPCRGQAAKERAVFSQTCTAGEDPACPTGAGGRSSRGAKKLLSPPGPSADGAALAEAESLGASPDRESRILNIQQRIRELTAESAEAKPGSLRRSFRSRPLSADLTKLFSSSAASSDGRLERQSEPDRKPLSETQEVPESKARPPSGPDCREAPVLGPPWKPQQTVKVLPPDGPLEKVGGFARERPSGTLLQAEGPPSPADCGPKPPSTAAADAPRPRTVRATVFEHSVQRHHVAVDRLVAEPGHGREPWPERQALAQKVPSKPADAPLQAEKPGRAKRFPEDPASAPREKLTAKPTPRQVEDSLQPQRIEPRYEVLQTVGERVRSEAVAAVAEDKAVTLRSRRSLRERRGTEEGVAAAASWPRSLDLQGGGWPEDGSASKAKELKRCCVQRRDVPPSQPLASYEQAREWKRSQARQPQPVAVRAAPTPSRHQGLRAAEDAVPSLPSERGKEKPEVCLADETEASPLPTRFPESLGARPGHDARATAGVNGALAQAGGQEGPLSPGAASQWPSSQGAPEGVDTRTCAPEDPRVLGLRKRPPAHSAKEEPPAAPGCLLAEEPWEPLGVDEGVRRSPRGVSSPRAADRWRRRTLPHFEDPGALAAESSKGLSRRDSLQLHSSSLAKRQRGGAEPRPRGGSAASPSRPGDSPQQPRSPSEPSAAPGGPGENDRAAAPPRSQPASPEAPLRSPGAAPPRGPHRQASARFADPPGSLERQRSKSWGEGGTPGDARGEPSRHRGGALFQAEPKPPSCARPGPQDPPGPQNGSRAWARGKGADGYRPRVLDIDALMAEYKDSPQQGGSGSFPWEKLACRRSSAEKISGSHRLSSPKGPDRSPGSSRLGLLATTDLHWPQTLRPSEQERVEHPAREMSPPQARDGSLSPPHWGRLAVGEPQRLPADPPRTRKKTFILDEDCGESLLLRHQQAKDGGGDPRLDMGLGAGQAPPEGGFRKGLSPAQQVGGARLEERSLKAVLARGLDRRGGGGADVGFSTSPVEARAGSSPPEPSLASAPQDLRRSYSEKVRQSRARGGLPVEAGAREGGHQSSLPRRADGWLGRRGTQDASFRDEKRDLESERPELWPCGAGLRSPPCLPARRRSRSFYKERKMDPWAADQLKECFGRPAAEAKDTDTLVQEADSQYGTWRDQRHSGDSFVPESPSAESPLASARKQSPGSRPSSFSSHMDPPSTADQQDSSRDQRSTSLDRSSTDVDSADGAEGSVLADGCPDFSFLGLTPVLDSSALKTRVQLSKRRRQRRAPISHSLRRSTGGDADRRPPVAEEGGSAWMFRDCTEVKPAKRDDSEQQQQQAEEEAAAARPVERSPGSQPQRLPVFPGMDHSILKAQLRKRQEAEGAGGGSPAQLTRSPKSPFQARAPGPRGLPAGVEKEERAEEPSPQWLRELKSKKRQSHHENQV